MKLQDILGSIEYLEVHADGNLQIGGITADSRRVKKDDLFVAISGFTSDGNRFIPMAMDKGAAVVVTAKKPETDVPYVLVPSDRKALAQCAAALYGHPSKAMTMIGITGTNGKTTTKELVHAVLSRRYRTHATTGNHNNHLGVPLTLLGIPANAEIAIIEMGANHPGEIASLCAIANPDYGRITNVGRAHLEGFGSFEGVIRTKTELYRHLAAKQGTAFVNANNDILIRQAAEYHLATVTYGDSDTAQVRGHLVGSDPYMKYYMEDGDNVYSIQSQLLGNYNFDNAMAASAVGRYFRVDYWDIKEAIEQYIPSNNRSQYKETGRNVLILDCYNANPSSMGVALDNFEALKRENKVAMLGNMRELGTDSRAEHEKIVARLTARNDMKAVLVGAEFEFAHQKASDRLLWFADVQAAVKYFEQNPLNGCTVLLKGSNGTRMWELEKVL
jgi:UDP-N-acetylmuramoyl-tripeptide--D-alanyl-D-alanine ligase